MISPRLPLALLYESRADAAQEGYGELIEYVLIHVEGISAVGEECSLNEEVQVDKCHKSDESGEESHGVECCEYVCLFHDDYLHKFGFDFCFRDISLSVII